MNFCVKKGVVQSGLGFHCSFSVRADFILVSGRLSGSIGRWKASKSNCRFRGVRFIGTDVDLIFHVGAINLWAHCTRVIMFIMIHYGTLCTVCIL